MKIETLMKAGISAGIAAGAAALIVAGAAQGQMMAPFGNDEDIAYAKTLWGVLESANLIGEDAIAARPYVGVDPHGAVLETLSAKVTVDGHTGAALVKKNYGPKGVKIEDVAKEPTKHLGAITVMFKREAGYDPEDKDWFWVKYLPDGSLDKTPDGMQLAGKVAKGMNLEDGCIACHSGAEGDDMVFTPIYWD